MTSGSSFNPQRFLQTWSESDFTPSETQNFQQCITRAFNLSTHDSYVYRAHGTTTLAMTQSAIDAKRKNGLHNWYHDEKGNNAFEPPPQSDIHAYICIFSPSASLPKALKAFKANAKAKSLRSSIATHLDSRFLNRTEGLLPSKKSRAHVNPYFSFWSYSCQELEWSGPWPNTCHTQVSHHMLPVLYHHFGCVVPSFAALHVLAKLAQPSKPSKESVKPILDVGSGNGYWTFMLRSLEFEGGGNMLPLRVYAVDNQLSEYRITWISDTIIRDGLKFLSSYQDPENGLRIDGGKGCILLLVYPQATTDFTSKMLKEFQGDIIVVAGTQNDNGFTAFKDCVVDQWMEKNMGNDGWELTLRMPLPSFAGKDEALFVFQRQKPNEGQ